MDEHLRKRRPGTKVKRKGYVWCGVCLGVCSFFFFVLFFFKKKKKIVPSSRALISDMSPPSKQQIAQALVTTSQMVTAIVCPLLGVAFFVTSDPYQWLFLMGAIFMALSGKRASYFVLHACMHACMHACVCAFHSKREQAL